MFKRAKRRADRLGKSISQLVADYLVDTGSIRGAIPALDPRELLAFIATSAK